MTDIKSGIISLKRRKAPTNKKAQNNRIDALFLVSVIVLCLLGTLAVFSAGRAYAYARYDDEDYFIKKQLIWLLLGFAVLLIASHISPDVYLKYTPHFYIGTLVLLILVLVIGFVGNGAQRWISIGNVTCAC